MREILFRGKRIFGDGWAYGSYYHYRTFEYDLNERHTIMECKEPVNAIATIEHVEVDPSTVGQYTGLTDKNGKRIFEGDVVEGHCHSAWSHGLQRCEVAYGRDGFEARNHIEGLDSDYYTYRVLFSKDVVVIGNVHDNPELLDGENGE